MRPDYIIEYLFRQGQLTALSGNPFDYVEFKRDVVNSVETFTISKWNFPQSQIDLATEEAKAGYQTYLANRTKIIERDEAGKQFDTTIRRFALVDIDEHNIAKDWMTKFKAIVAASSTFADFKTRVAAIGALPNTPQRTPAQLKTAMDTKD